MSRHVGLWLLLLVISAEGSAATKKMADGTAHTNFLNLIASRIDQVQNNFGSGYSSMLNLVQGLHLPEGVATEGIAKQLHTVASMVATNDTVVLNALDTASRLIVRYDKLIAAILECGMLNQTGISHCPLDSMVEQAIKTISTGVPELSHLFENTRAPGPISARGGSRPMAPSFYSQPVKIFGMWTASASFVFWATVGVYALRNTIKLNILKMMRQIFRPHQDVIERSIAASKERDIRDLEIILNVYPTFSAYKRVHSDMNDDYKKELISKICGRSSVDDGDDNVVENCWSQAQKAGVANSSKVQISPETMIPILACMILFGSQPVQSTCSPNPNIDCGGMISTGSICVSMCVTTKDNLSFRKHDRVGIAMCGRDGVWYYPSNQICDSAPVVGCYSAAVDGISLAREITDTSFTSLVAAKAKCDESSECVGVGFGFQTNYRIYKLIPNDSTSVTNTQGSRFYFKGGCGHRQRINRYGFS